MSEKTIAIGYFADGPWAHEAFNLISAEPSMQIKFICLRYNSEDNILSGLAEKYNIPCLKVPNINDSKFLEQVKTYDCDIFVSMSFDQIFKKEIINLPPGKVINCHAGKLPFYRGRNILNWVLINDEKEFGITVHYVDEGIDTGDIILQKVFPICDDDSYKTLLTTAYKACAELLVESLRLYIREDIIVTKQSDIHPVGFYCGKRGEGDELLNWELNSRDIFNFIRAICEPGPMARSSLNGEEIKINKCELIRDAVNYRCIPGQVVGKSGKSLIVKTGDSTIKIVEYYYDGSIRVGDRLGTIL